MPSKLNQPDSSLPSELPNEASFCSHATCVSMPSNASMHREARHWWESAMRHAPLQSYYETQNNATLQMPC